MCQPSSTIAGFLQQAEGNLALLSARADGSPRRGRHRLAAEDSVVGSPPSLGGAGRHPAVASTPPRVLMKASADASDDARDQLELQARTMLGLDRRVR
ncbi:unnamed protein product, partial [Polarella glacialis]